MPSLQEQGICSICKKPYNFCGGCELVDEEIDYDDSMDDGVYEDEDGDYNFPDEDDDWTDEDEDALEEWEDERRRKLAERNEY